MHVRALRKRGSCQCVQCPGASDGALVVPWAVPVQASVEKIEKHTPVEEELQARPSSRSTVDSVLAVPPATTGLDYYPNGLAAAKEMALKKNKEIMDKVGPGMAGRVSHSIHCCWAGRHRPHASASAIVSAASSREMLRWPSDEAPVPVRRACAACMVAVTSQPACCLGKRCASVQAANLALTPGLPQAARP